MQGAFPQVIAAGIYDAAVARRGQSESEPRFPSAFEIELPLAAGGISYVDGERMPISPDTVICARAGQSRHTRFPFRCYYLHMTVTEGLLYETLASLPSFVHTEQPGRYRALFERIVADYERGEAKDDLLLMSDVFALVANLKKDANLQLSFDEKKGAHAQTVRDACRYIGDTLGEDLSLSAVAARFGFSPIYFHKIFKSVMGVTLRDYVEGERIRRASHLIVSTDMTLTEIAYAVGFSSQSYFSAAFRRRMNMPPRAYARAQFSRYEK